MVPEVAKMVAAAGLTATSNPAMATRSLVAVNAKIPPTPPSMGDEGLNRLADILQTEVCH